MKKTLSLHLILSCALLTALPVTQAKAFDAPSDRYRYKNAPIEIYLDTPEAEIEPFRGWKLHRPVRLIPPVGEPQPQPLSPQIDEEGIITDDKIVAEVLLPPVPLVAQSPSPPALPVNVPAAIPVAEPVSEPIAELVSKLVSEPIVEPVADLPADNAVPHLRKPFFTAFAAPAETKKQVPVPAAPQQVAVAAEKKPEPVMVPPARTSAPIPVSATQKPESVATSLPVVPAAVPEIPAAPIPAITAQKKPEPVATSLPVAPEAIPEIPAAAKPVTETPAATQKEMPAPAQAAAVPAHNDLSIVFDKNSSQLSPQAEKDLSSIAGQMNDLPDMRLQIRAYAAGEESGTASNARRMSLSRGLIVRSYLADHGIKPVRLDVRALGAQTDKTPIDRVDLVFVR